MDITEFFLGGIMSKELKGDIIRDIPKGKMLKDEYDGDLIKTEGPDGKPLWKKKKKLNEQGEEIEQLNE